MKTVLAPNAPWPVVEKPLTEIVKKPRVPRVKISATSKINRTNANFDAWAKKNLGVKQ